MHAKAVILGIVVAFINQIAEGSNTYPVLLEPSFYRALSSAAEQHGIDLYVFTAADYQPRTGQLQGYRFHQNRFVRQSVPLPDVIYDRCFFTNADQRQNCRKMLASIKLQKPYQMLNSVLPAKLGVYHALKEDDRLKPYLPITSGYQSSDQLMRLMQLHAAGVVLKPASGMQGRGLLHAKLCQHEQSVHVNGRTKQNQPFTITFAHIDKFKRWINRIVSQTAYLIQPYLELSDDDGKPFDIRVLLQKDSQGRWASTGAAARSGKKGSLTSNLHGGGEARSALQLLTNKFDRAKAEHLLETIHTISKQTAERIEDVFGRFAELGLDFGIDKGGRVWLIEVNSKPGRSAFRLISDQKAEHLSIERPLLYARLLSRRLKPSFVANETANGRSYYLKTAHPLRPFNVQEVHQ